MKKISAFVFFIFTIQFIYAQNTDMDIITVDTIEFVQIDLYDKFNPIAGGDSVRLCGKHKCNGNITDKYENGNVLHKGYYTNGVLLNGYENFFENGNTERTFKTKTANRGSMKVYYRDSKLRTEAEFFKGQPILWKDYYHNGNIEYWEEYDKNYKVLLTMNFYFENGYPESKLEISDKKKKLYSSEEYYENGKIKENGLKRHVPQNGGYVKEGVWQLFDENGNLTATENYFKGHQYDE